VTRKVLAGAGVLLLYLGGALLSSHLSPATRRPLLDGIGPPPPYHWVEPPPALAATNKKAEGGRFPLIVKGGRSAAGAFTTGDSQLALVLQPGALPVSAAVTGAEVEVTPLGGSSATPPPGKMVDGNVFRISIKTEPSGSAVARFRKPQSTLLTYPADQSFRQPQHFLAFSRDRRTWTLLETSDSPAQQQVSADLPAPGYVAVMIPVEPTAAIGKSVYVGGGLALLAVAGGALALYLRRRRGQSDPDRP
jgi:hypothetical protein